MLAVALSVALALPSLSIGAPPEPEAAANARWMAATGAALGTLVGGFAIPVATRAVSGVDVPTPPIVMLACAGAFTLSSAGAAIGTTLAGGDARAALAIAAAVSLVSAVGAGSALAFGWQAFAVRSPSTIDRTDPAVLGHNVALVVTAVGAALVAGAVAGAPELWRVHEGD